MGPLVHKYTGVALPTAPPSGVVEQEQPVRSTSYSTASAPGGMSQSITFGSNPGEVTGLRVEMSNGFFPTPSSFYFGMVRFAFYEDLSDSPTGPPLVTSPFYNASYLNTGPVTSFYPVFSGWTPTAFTKYVLVAEFYDHFDYPIYGIQFGANSAGGYADGVFKRRSDPFGPRYTSQLDIGTGFTSVGSYDLTFAVYATSSTPVVACSSATGTLQQSNDDTGNAYGLGGTLDRFGQYWASGSTLKPATVTGACFRLRKIGTPTGTIKLIVENSETEEADPAAAEGTEYDLSGITGIATDYFFDLGQTFVVGSDALYVALEVSGTFDGSNYISVTGGTGNSYDGVNSSARGVAFPSTILPTSADTWFQVYGTSPPVTDDDILRLRDGTYRRRYSWGF
jgi:hypothetical protein